MVFQFQDPVPIPDHDFSNLFNHAINIPESSSVIPDSEWDFSTPIFINDISFHWGNHQCQYGDHCYNATFLCGSCYYNSFGDLTKCGFISYSDSWFHRCLGEGFQLSIDPQHIDIEFPESNWSSDFFDEYIYDNDWDKFSCLS